MRFAGPVSVFEAEIMGLAEALSWLHSRFVHRDVIKTDSLLTARAIISVAHNRLEVGDAIDSCRAHLHDNPDFSIIFVRK